MLESGVAFRPNLHSLYQVPRQKHVSFFLTFLISNIKVSHTKKEQSRGVMKTEIPMLEQLQLKHKAYILVIKKKRIKLFFFKL